MVYQRGTEDSYRAWHFFGVRIIQHGGLKVGTWVGGKALPCTVLVFDMGAFVSLNLISTKQPSFRKCEKISSSNECAEVISTNLKY